MFAESKSENMKQLLVITILILCSTLKGIAQKAVVTGKVIDTSHQIHLEGATISLINTKDSSLVTFVRTDSSGNFLIKNVDKGKYRLSASYTGYYPSWKNIVVNGQALIDLGKVIMRDKSLLSTIEVEADKPPVSVNGDTL